MKRLLTLSLTLLAAVTLHAQSAMPIDAEVGYRWLDLEGSENVYRTQINEQDGLLLRSLRISSGDLAGGALDHFRLDASDLGVGPAGAFRIEAGKSSLWKMNLSFRQADAFNAHPGFALGQHTIDRQRTNFDLDVEFLPGRTISPFVGYSHGSYDGPGTTTYLLGQDEFLLNSDLDEREQEFRAGFGFNAGNFYGVVTQGWRKLQSDEKMTLAPGANAGNNPGTILGRPIDASGITRDSSFDVDTPFTNAFVTGQVTSRIRLIGNFSRFNAEGDGPEVEESTGRFASFALSRFYNGLSDSVASRAENTTWRGGLRTEVTLTSKLDLLAGWQTEHRDLNGAAAFHTIFRDTVNFSGADPVAALEEVFNTESAMERKQDTLEVGVSARELGPFSLRATFRQTNQDVTLSPDLEEIVVSGPEQGGEYERSINTIDVVGAYRIGSFSTSLALRSDRADDAILRTDYQDRDRLRLRAAYIFPKWVRVGAMAERIDHENDSAGVGYDSETNQYGADVQVSLSERFELRGAYTRFDTDAVSLIRRPESFVTEQWNYVEDGDALEGGFSFLFAPVTFDADFARYDNEGSNAFGLDRYRARVAWDLFAHAGVAAEWSRDQYDETLLPIANFKATRYGLYLRWRQ